MRPRTPGPSPSAFLHLLLSLCCWSQPSCHSWKAEAVSPSTLIDSLHPTLLRVTTPTQPRLEVWHPIIRADVLQGFRSNSGAFDSTRTASLEIPVAAITRVETRHGSTLKTLGLVYLIVLAFAIPFAIGNGSSY